MLDWEEITKMWNQISGHSHSVSEMLSFVYNREASVERAADYLGVSTCAITRKMDLLNVPRTRRIPWPGSYSEKLQSIPDSRMKTMSAGEIAREIGCPRDHVYKYLGRDNRRWKRTYKGAKK